MNYLLEKLNGYSDTESALYTSQKYFLMQEIMAVFAYSVVDGMFLSSLLLRIGASDLFIAVMFSIPVFSSIIQVFTPVFYERQRYRKKYMMLCLGIHRFSKCFIVFVPLVFNPAESMPVIFVIYLVSNLVSSFNGPAHNNFCISLLKEKGQYRFMALRQALSMAIMVLVYAVMGQVLDSTGNSYAVYVIAYVLSFFTSIISLWMISKVNEPENEVTVVEKADYWRNYGNVLKDSRYVRFMLFTLVFYFAFYLSAAFKTVYMLKYLHASYMYVAVNESLVYVMIIIFSVYLVRASRTAGWDRLLVFSLFFYIAQFLLLAVSGNATLYFYMLHSVTLGVATAAFNLAVLNYRFQIMPGSSKTFYDSVFGIVFGCAALIAPLAGACMQNRMIHVMQDAVFAYRLLFFISAVLVCASLALLVRMKKE